MPQTGQHRVASQVGTFADYLADGDPGDICPCKRCGKLTKLLIEEYLISCLVQVERGPSVSVIADGLLFEKPDA